MTEEEVRLDPTAFGLFIVAACMLPLAVANLWNDARAAADIGSIFYAAGLLLVLITVWCWKCKANFGFCVFGLVALGVFLTGFCARHGDDLGVFFNIGLAIMFAIFTGLSVMIKTPKLLTVIILMTALIFLFVGISGLTDASWVPKVCGVWCIINFISCIALGFGLVSDGKFPYF